MKRLAWLTDLHLGFATSKEIVEFCTDIKVLPADAILIGGDVGEASNITEYLQMLEDNLRCPIFFVLGNHDFYHGSITSVRSSIREFVMSSKFLKWLPVAGSIEITKNTCLIGHGAWADGRFGNYKESRVMLNDYRLIEDFVGLSRRDCFKKINELGDEAASFFSIQLNNALPRFEHILILTHVPPFRESCWRKGRPADENYLPHFSCQAVGDILKGFMRQNPDKRMTVLCGHTHYPAEVLILPNLFVKTGRAEYGRPGLQEILVIK